VNIRRGFFRLTLVLSILVGILSSFLVLEHTIENEHGIVQKCLPYGLQIRIGNEERARTVERIAKRQYPYDIALLRLLHSKTHQSFGPDYILFWWRHLAVLSLPGFVTVWFIYGFTGWVIIPFIVRGFQGSSAKGGESA
jgi:hypothetical protein